ncbi:hypothetical protein SUGI_0986150 [Cryptomeria japonica]|nr:hypothetical protein SUGI_0986150 [Cryptomeria japonica]
MEETTQRYSMQLKLEIVGATNIALKTGCKGSLFVRYYLNKSIAVNTKEVEASSAPEWRETFWLECEGEGSNETLSAFIMQPQMIAFQVRWRRRGLLRGFKSKVVGRLEISWNELLSSPILSINHCFPLQLEKGKFSHDLHVPTSTLHVGVSVILADSLAAITKTHKHQKEIISQTSSVKDLLGCQKNGGRDKREDFNQRLKRLERDECECGGEVCMIHHDSQFWCI